MTWTQTKTLMYEYIDWTVSNQFLLLTMSFADDSACPAELVTRHVNFPVSSSYVDVISKTALLPSCIIWKYTQISWH